MVWKLRSLVRPSLLNVGRTASAPASNSSGAMSCHKWLESVGHLFRGTLERPLVGPGQRPHHAAHEIGIFCDGLRTSDEIFHEEFGDRRVLAFGVVDEHDREARG